MLRSALVLLSAAGLFSAPASAQAPGGHRSLADLAGGFIQANSQYGANLIAGTLEAAMRRSRETARVDSKPIPEDIRNALIPFFPAELLDTVRYTVGDTSPDGLAGFAIRNGNAAAVTLIDTVVFSDEGHVQNIALWSHELHHVQQYQDWGVSGFASRYAFGWREVEAEATARAREFVAWYKKRTGQN